MALRACIPFHLGRAGRPSASEPARATAGRRHARGRAGNALELFGLLLLALPSGAAVEAAGHFTARLVPALRSGAAVLRGEGTNPKQSVYRVGAADSALSVQGAWCASTEPLSMCYVASHVKLPKDCASPGDDPKGKAVQQMKSFDLFDFGLGGEGGWRDANSRSEHHAKQLLIADIYVTVPSELKRLAVCLAGSLVLLPEWAQPLGYSSFETRGGGLPPTSPMASLSWTKNELVAVYRPLVGVVSRRDGGCRSQTLVGPPSRRGVPQGGREN